MSLHSRNERIPNSSVIDERNALPSKVPAPPQTATRSTSHNNPESSFDDEIAYLKKQLEKSKEEERGYKGLYDIEALGYKDLLSQSYKLAELHFKIGERLEGEREVARAKQVQQEYDNALANFDKARLATCAALYKLAAVYKSAGRAREMTLIIDELSIRNHDCLWVDRSFELRRKAKSE
jgi:hypothetical protein